MKKRKKERKKEREKERVEERKRGTEEERKKERKNNRNPPIRTEGSLYYLSYTKTLATTAGSLVAILNYSI